MDAMKERRIRDFIAGLFDGRREEALSSKTREVPVLSEEEIALHTGMRKSGLFTADNAAKLYPKRAESK